MARARREVFLIFSVVQRWSSKSLLSHITSHWSGVHDEIHLVRWHRHVLIKDLTGLHEAR